MLCYCDLLTIKRSESKGIVNLLQKYYNNGKKEKKRFESKGIVNLLRQCFTDTSALII